MIQQFRSSSSKKIIASRWMPPVADCAPRSQDHYHFAASSPAVEVCPYTPSLGTSHN